MAFVATRSRAQSSAPVLLREPSISRTQIAFRYAGNIWIADRDGSHLRRLTSGGHEARPALSPDGSQVAFVGEYDGTRAVYVVPSSGGEPRRLTYHPADLGIGSMQDSLAWTPDGKHILFNSRRAAFSGYAGESFTSQILKVPVEGGAVTALPFGSAVEGSLSPDGSRIAYVPIIQRQREWKRYHGGETTPIWIANLADSSIEAKIPRENFNDSNPMWIGETVYFLSDRKGPVTLFAYDLKSKQVREVVKNDGFDIKSASCSADAIVYDQLGSLHVLDLQSGENRTLDIHPLADFAEVRPHFKKLGFVDLRFVELSPTGARVAFGALGDILTISADKGEARNLTETTDVAERDPAWSPDEKSIAYFSDESGDYALHIRDIASPSKVKKINLGNPPAFFYSPSWSPDAQKIAYSDQRLNYWYVDLEKKAPVRIDADVYAGPQHSRNLAWSPDSRWIAYARQLATHLHAIFVYSLDQAKAYQITDGRADALYPAFDKSGQYLYFTASTDVALSPAWLDMSSMRHPITRSVYAAMLSKDAPSPLGSQGDEERSAEAAKNSEGQAREMKTARVEINLEGIQQRLVALPIPGRNYYDLAAGQARTIFLVEGPQVNPLDATAAAPVETKIHRLDLQTGKSEQILDAVTAFNRTLAFVTSFHVSLNGEKMLYAKNNQWFLASAKAGPPAGREEPLKLDGLEVYVEPRAEWKHMYAQAWRGERDFFYDPGLHGLNLDKIRKQYEPFLEGLATRDDLNYLFSEMLANMSAGHIGAAGGESPEAKRVKVGLLGADYTVENGRYRFERIYPGDPWNPELRAPLTEPHVNVQAGEYLLSVNGREVRPTVDLYHFFQETAGKQTVLRVGSKADGSDERDVTVTPVEDEASLRYSAWVEEKRRKVDALSGGRVAYIHVPDTYVRGYVAFNRDYFAQVGKEAALIDARYNAGGLIADYIVDNLNRPRLNFWHLRFGMDSISPQQSIYGPKAMLINEMAGSGGDWLPWGFRRAGIGPLIGKRTWGGLVGGYGFPDDLLDGGFVSTPDLAFYNPDGAWDVENHGVAPDIEVEDDPKAARAGHDLQLEKGVAVLLERLPKNPPPPPQHPPYPNYQKSAP